MKALVLNAVGRGFDFEDVDISAPIGREVLVDVRASGLCHTDLLFATNSIVPMPAVLGHEVAGIVAEIGPDVRQFRVGDHVVGSLAQCCGACARCLSGRSFQCLSPESTVRKATDPPRLSRRRVGLFQGFGLGGFAERALDPRKPTRRRTQGTSIRPSRSAGLRRCDRSRSHLEYGSSECRRYGCHFRCWRRRA